MDHLSLDEGSPRAGRTFSGLESWIMATILPSAAGFRALLADPTGSRRRAYLWVSVAALLPFLLTLRPELWGAAPAWRADLLALATRLVAALVGLALLVAPTHLLAGLLGGHAPYAHLEYACAAWYAPLVLIAGLPVFRAAGVAVFSPLAIYAALLGVVSIRAVYGFGWGRAMIAALAWPLVVFLLYREGAQLLAQGAPWVSGRPF